MIDKPLFSIIIPVYNRAHIVLKTLQSINEQTFKNYELIIVDDGSTDNLKIVFDSYICKNKISNWYYYFKINGERGAARNYGIQKSNGKWITFLDSDDLFYPNHLSIASNFISKNDKIIVFHSAYEFRNQKNELIKKIIYPKNSDLNIALLKGNLLSCFGMFLNSDIFYELKFEEDRQLSGSEDWLLWLEVSARYKLHFQSQVSGCMIQHDGRSVLSFNEDELLTRTNLIVNKLHDDKIFVQKYGQKIINRIHGHMLTYSALHLTLSGNKKNAIRLFINGLKYNPSELLTIRTLAFFKRLFLS